MKSILFKITLHLFTVFLLGITTKANAQGVGDEFEVNFITYNITSITPNTVETFDYNTEGETTVVIPSTVESPDGGSYSVTTIREGSFDDNLLTSITSLATPPPTITTGGSNDTLGATCHSCRA